jgi:DNA-binding transcriptional LysR family regulator
MKGAMRSNALVVLRDLAIAGHGVAMVADFLVTEALTRGALERVLPTCVGAGQKVPRSAANRTSLALSVPQIFLPLCLRTSLVDIV